MGILKSILSKCVLFVGCLLPLSAFAADYVPPHLVSCKNTCEYGKPFYNTEIQACDCHRPPKSSSTTSNDSGNGNSADACYNTNLQYNSIFLKCQSEQTNTAQNCDSKQNKEMNSITNQASQMAVAMGAQSSGISGACSAMGQLMGGANAAIASYRLICSSAISSCKSACGELAALAEANSSCFAGEGIIESARDYANNCSSYDAKVQEASTAMQNFISTATNAKQCAALTAGMPSICSSYPGLPGCNPNKPVNCADAASANNTVCKCAGANATSYECLQGLKADGQTPIVAGGTADNSSRWANSVDNMAGLGGDIPETPLIAAGQVKPSGPGGGVDGKQGGGANLGGGSGGGSGGGAGGGSGGGEAEDSSVDSGGFYGGGGAGGRGGYTGGSREAASEGSYGSGGAPRAAGGPDLRQFLPGGQFDPKRSISGASGPDGITGPNSSIWQKIQNRYRATSPTLLP